MLIGKTLLSRYKITQKLGSGGFGDTYRAIDMALPGHPPCVVKNLKPKDSNPAAFPIAKKLFDREAEFLYHLGKHDQIPTLYAHFSEGGEFYLVEEFVEGDDLSKQIVPQKPLSSEQTVKLLREILEILAVIHQHNVIHRDIKPPNIIRRKQDGKLVLIDFGAVKEISALTVNSQGLTSLTVGIGSPGYMPSEQAKGKPKLASDVYAVGMIGIEALTGVTPDQLKEDPDTGEIIWRNLVQVNDSLADVLSKMVRDHFSLRYKNASEALGELVPTIVSAKPPPPRSTVLSPKLSLMQQRSSSPNRTPQLSLKPVKLSPWAVLVGLAVAAITGIAVINKSPSPTSQPENSSPTGTPSPTSSPLPTPSPTSSSTASQTAKDFFNQGYKKDEQGDYKGAIEDYTQAIRINPNYADAYNNRGLARYQLGEYQAAIEDYTQAIRINPNDADAYYSRGIARKNLGDKRRAISDFLQAAELYKQQGNTEWYQNSLDQVRRLQQ
ncbi:MAG: tetratricopeptide repeat protein [Xenococcaceae cyanobacterium]